MRWVVTRDDEHVGGGWCPPGRVGGGGGVPAWPWLLWGVASAHAHATVDVSGVGGVQLSLVVVWDDSHVATGRGGGCPLQHDVHAGGGVPAWQWLW